MAPLFGTPFASFVHSRARRIRNAQDDGPRQRVCGVDP